jgi:hypothetical protein
MARSRNIKPGFFENEDLAELGPGGMMLFAGLWTLADREGRLEDRPKRIKAQLFPYFDFDVDGYLDGLQERGFVVRYEAANARYIQVVNFGKHQSPHIKEAPSTIPAPDKHGASTEVAALIPDSLSSDSGLSDCGLPEPDAPPAPKRKTKAQIPEDFFPDVELMAWTVAQGWDAARVGGEVEKFRDHHRKLGNLFLDHRAAWRTWTRKGLEIDADRRARASPVNGKPTASDLFLAAGRRVQERHDERGRGKQGAGDDQRALLADHAGGGAQHGPDGRDVGEGAGGRAIEAAYRERP